MKIFGNGKALEQGTNYLTELNQGAILRKGTFRACYEEKANLLEPVICSGLENNSFTKSP